MENKIKEILSNRADYYIDSNGKSHDIIRGHPDDIMDEIVKLFAIPAVMGELTCDSCGCHPNVIYTTSKGRFCERCKPAS